jgi:hypothetical protein
MPFPTIAKALFTPKKIATILLTSPLLLILFNVQFALIGLAILIFLDLLTGIKKSLYEKEVSFNPLKKLFWKSIKSYLLRQTWKKTYEYGIGIVVFATIEGYFLFSGEPSDILGRVFSLTELVIYTAAVIEAFSIWENLTAVGKPSKFVLGLQAITRKLIALLPQWLQKYFKDGK